MPPDGSDAPPGLAGAPDAGAGAPGAGPGAAPGGPKPPAAPAGPTGISPAMQGTPNQGAEMEARVAVNFLANRLTEMAGKLGLHSELGKAMHKAAGILAKAVPAGSVPQGAEVAQLQRIMQAGRQNAANVASMRQGGGGPPGAPTPVPRPPSIPGAVAA
jgi:hypothetical protein